MIINQDFEMVSGDTKKLQVTITRTEGDPVNLEGCTIRWGFIKGSVSLAKDNLAGTDVTITDAPAGKAEIIIQPEDTEGLLGAYIHQCEVTDREGSRTTVLQGTINIIRSYV